MSAMVLDRWLASARTLTHPRTVAFTQRTVLAGLRDVGATDKTRGAGAFVLVTRLEAFGGVGALAATRCVSEGGGVREGATSLVA
jgi:hypothetical protein